MSAMEAALARVALRAMEMADDETNEATADAFDAIHDMLWYATQRKRSPLLVELWNRSKGKQDEIALTRAKTYAREWAILAMLELGYSKHRAAKEASALAGISFDSMKHLLPTREQLKSMKANEADPEVYFLMMQWAATRNSESELSQLMAQTAKSATHARKLTVSKGRVYELFAPGEHFWDDVV